MNKFKAWIQKQSKTIQNVLRCAITVSYGAIATTLIQGAYIVPNWVGEVLTFLGIGMYMFPLYAWVKAKLED